MTSGLYFRSNYCILNFLFCIMLIFIIKFVLQSIGSVDEVISVTSLAVSEADSNTTADTIHEDNKLSNIVTNEENWTDVNLNEDTEQRNVHNLQFRGL